MKIRRMVCLSILLSGFLVSCSGRLGGNSVRSKRMRALGFEAVPLTQAQGLDSRVGVKAGINHTEALLLVDSGANATRISESVAESAGVKAQKGIVAVSRGALGRPIKIKQGIGALSLGGLTVAPYLFSLGKDEVKPTAVGDFDGHIGADGLTQTGALVDIPSNVIWVPKLNAQNVDGHTIYPLSRQNGLGMVAKSFQLAKQSDHFIIQSRVSGTPVSWVIDTGAEISIVTEKGAKRMGLSPQKSNVSFLDAHGDKAKLKLATVPAISFGGFTAIGLQVGVAKLPSLGNYFTDKSGKSVDGILGMDFLRQTGSLIDASSRILYIGRP